MSKQRAKERKQRADADPAGSGGALRRRRLKACTLKLYTSITTPFYRRHLLCPTSPAEDIDLALDRELHDLYFAGVHGSRGGQVYSAVRWSTVLTNAQLRYSHVSMLGFKNDSKSKRPDPVTWEATLLIANAIATDEQNTPMERVAASIGVLLSFDLYCRGGDLAQVAARDLSPPMPGQTGAAANWSVTLFPLTGPATSKANQNDDTIMVGTSDPARAWIAQLMPYLRDLPRPHGVTSLLAMTPQKFGLIFKRAVTRAGVPACTLHQLRHGGASADGAKGNMTDMQIRDRGRWATLGSVLNYRRPAPYLRQLRQLSAQQKLTALSVESSLPLMLSGVVSPLRRKTTFTSERRVMRRIR